MKGEVDKLNTNKLVNVLTGLDNLKTEVEDLNVDELKSVLMDLKNLSDLVSKEVVKKIKIHQI